MSKLNGRTYVDPEKSEVRRDLVEYGGWKLSGLRYVEVVWIEVCGFERTGVCRG